MDQEPILKQNEESSTLLKQKIVKNPLKLKHEIAFSHLKLVKQTEYRLLLKCGKADNRSSRSARC